MSNQQLPIKITGRFAHFYPESIIEIPDDFWAKLRKELYPPHLFRPENAIDLYLANKVTVTASTSFRFEILKLSEKTQALIYYMWLQPWSGYPDCGWYIYINGVRQQEVRGGNQWKALGPASTVADYVHIRLAPSDKIELEFVNVDNVDATVNHVSRGYKWIEN
jgi:hypothetical protein